MERIVHEDKTFEKVVYAEKLVKGREFQSCTFVNCDFSNSEFYYSKFMDCTFDGCNLSMMKLSESTVNNVTFRNSKILGVNFSECQDFLFSVSFDSCILDYSSFLGKKMLKTRFIRTSMKEVNFNKTNLSQSLFDQTDLSGALFDATNLTAANLVSAYGFAIDPEHNVIKKASFSQHGLAGLLARYQINVV
ncbi:MAG: pentapeptide repeat-containing protein [Arcticibacter sp.]